MKLQQSHTGRYLFTDATSNDQSKSIQEQPTAWLKLANIERNNITGLNVAFPLGVMTSVTGVSGSGKSSLVSQALVELINEALGQKTVTEAPVGEADLLEQELESVTGGEIIAGMEHIRRLININQKAIGRTPRSNLATYTGLFDDVRKLFAATNQAKAHGYDAGSVSHLIPKQADAQIVKA